MGAADVKEILRSLRGVSVIIPAIVSSKKPEPLLILPACEEPIKNTLLKLLNQ